MPFFVNDTSFVIDGSRTTVVSASPVIVNGMIVRVFNTGSTTQTYTYTDISLSETTVSVPASGSAGNPLYVLISSASATDFFNSSTGINVIRLLITGSELGNTFTEQLITATGAGTWTKPEGITQVIVECWGGGASGGGTTVNDGGGGGGSGGAYSRKLVRYSSAQQNIGYSVAASVAGSTGNGVNGNNTTWNTNEVVAQGGISGSAYSSLNAVGLPGIADTSSCVGDIINIGSNGGEGFFSTPFAIGGGGGRGAGSTIDLIVTSNGVGVFEFGGPSGQTVQIDSSGQDGNPGFNYAAGGSGGAKVSGGGRSGGAGAQGLIRLIYR